MFRWGPRRVSTLSMKGIAERGVGKAARRAAAVIRRLGRFGECIEFRIGLEGALDELFQGPCSFLAGRETETHCKRDRNEHREEDECAVALHVNRRGRALRQLPTYFVIYNSI